MPFSGLRGKEFSLSPISMILGLGSLPMLFISLRKFLSVPSLLKVYILNGFWEFFTCFFPSSDNGYVFFFSHLIDMLNYMDSFSNTELSLHPQNKPHLDVVYASSYVYMYSQLCLTLCDPNSSLPGSSVHGILLAIMLEWVAMPSSRESSQPRYRTQVSCIAGKFFTT